MLTYILYGLFILACIVLIVVVLLQPGKSDAGALFSSSVSSTAFGPRGTQSLMAKITIGAAAAFMLVALMLSLPVLTGSHSVLQSTVPEPLASPSQRPSPAASTAPASSPSMSPAPASSATDGSSSKPSEKPPTSPEAKKTPEQKKK